MQSIRTCLLTGKKQSRNELYKIIEVDGNLAIDYGQQIYTKSHYISKDQKILKEFIDNDSKKLRAKNKLEIKKLKKLIEEELIK